VPRLYAKIGTESVLAKLRRSRLFAWAGILALFAQILVPLVHDHADAKAAFAAAWHTAGAVAALIEHQQGKTPAKPENSKDPQCPICQSLQLASAFLVPALPVLPQPVVSYGRVGIDFAAEYRSSRSFSLPQSRAPPAIA
jgi:hypothetical protein